MMTRTHHKWGSIAGGLGVIVLTAAVWLSPLTVGPTGRFNPLLEVPGDCLFMFVILAVMGAGYFVACRRARGWWLWPLWLSLYMPSTLLFIPG